MASQADMTTREQSAPESTRQVPAGTQRIIPQVDVFENEDHLLIVADMPGVEPDAVDVRLEDADLSIRAVQPDRSGGDGSWVPLEFSRLFSVPQTIAPDGVTAELKAGVLYLRLAKAEGAKPKRIKVTSG